MARKRPQSSRKPAPTISPAESSRSESSEGVRTAARRNDASPDQSHERFPIVGIGASAGGLAALKAFFDKVPRDSGFAFVVVVHLSPDRESHLAELLQSHVSMPVQQVGETMPLERNHVYVIPPNANLDTIDTHLRLTELEQRRQERAPIDHFFRTLATTHDGDAIGVILTGTGSDGTLGLREIKERGGLTVVQDPGEAEYDGMPQSAIATGLVDLVLPLAKIFPTILRYSRTQPRLPVLDEEGEQEGDAQRLLQKIFAQLRARAGRDFSRYKPATILRRIQRRMQIRHIEELSAYLHLLRDQPDEVRLLADDLLITVTSFFRDPEVFDLLEKNVVPRLFEGKGAGDDLRIWSVGCATGEEAYSLAMLLLEEASRRDEPPRLQVFASDLHERSLKQAREGFFPGDIETDVSPERLKRFFSKENGGYRIDKEVREVVVFAPHNLMSDPPFSRLDMVACRNVLIYLQRDVQRDIIGLFHYALRPDGVLVLGTSETVETSDLFRGDPKNSCIYRRRNVQSQEPRLPVFPLVPPRLGDGSEHSEQTGEPIAYGALHQRMVERYAPPSMLISADDKLVHLSEHAGRYLVHPGGELTANVHKLIRDELRIELMSALHAAREKRDPVSSNPVPVQFEGEVRTVVTHVRPALESHEGFALVIFDERPRPAARSNAATSPAVDAREQGRAQELEAELNLTRQRLQSIIEEYETSQEEMRASNEELQSTNEELRSTMEELETSKEELQSMNEELQTVNQENRHKVEELAQLSGDLQNLMASTEIATLFLDRELRIMRFTPPVGDLFNVRTTDRGRPLTDLTHRLGYDGLVSDAQSVLKQLVRVEREVQDQQGRWYLARLLPYRSTEDRIEGVVITFVDFTARKQVEEALRHSEERVAVELAAMKHLHDLVGRLLVCHDLVTALEEVLAATIEITTAEMGNVQLLQPDGQTLKIVVQRGFDQEVLDYFANVRIDAESACARALRSGERTVIEDVQTDPQYEPLRDIAARAGYRAVQSTPLISRKGELLGVLSTHFPQPYRPSEEDLRLLDLYAQQAADFIERKRTEDALRSMNEQLENRVADRTEKLERQNQRLRRLASQLAQVEHQERRKLAMMLHDGLQQLLIAGKMQLPFCRERDHDAVERLEGLLNEAIDVSRSLSYELSPPALNSSDLPEALQWLARWFRSNHNFEVEVEVDEGFPVLADHLKAFLFTAVRELLLNSVKHSGAGGAFVSLKAQRSRKIRIRVSDRGKGFDPAQLRFDEEESNGLGLFSIRERLIALGGDFQVDSAPDEGARFLLELPLTGDEKPRDRMQAVPAASSPRRGPMESADAMLRILVVDDHRMFREGLRALAERHAGVQWIGQAADGAEALERVDELRPDVVLMDIDMPRMNGIEAARRMKTKHPEILIIGLSFHEEPETAEAMCRAGAAACVKKGGDAETLFATIRELYFQPES